jgi:hypothetical protein
VKREKRHEALRLMRWRPVELDAGGEIGTPKTGSEFRSNSRLRRMSRQAFVVPTRDNIFVFDHEKVCGILSVGAH